jgi:hypothetical protein
MTMNMGGTDNVADAQTAVSGGAQQVADVFGISTEDATKRMGMLPSIGVDNNGVVIDLTGATIRELRFFLCAVHFIDRVFILSVGNFAKESSLATLSYWNFNRDFPGGDTTTQSLDSSSSPDQTNPSEFFTTFQKALAGEAPLAAAGAQKSVEAGTVDALTISQPGQKAALPEPAPAGAPGGA